MIEFSIFVAALVLFCVRISNHNAIINKVDIEYKVEKLEEEISVISDASKASPLLFLLLYLLACVVSHMIPVCICIWSVFVFQFLSVIIFSFIKILLCGINDILVFISICKGKIIGIHSSNITLLRIGYGYDIFYYSFMAIIALLELLKIW